MSLKNLSFRDDGTFHILQFTDFHFGHSYDEDLNIVNLVEHHAEKSKPDLIVVTGDLISSFDYKGNESIENPDAPERGYYSAEKNAMEVWQGICDILEAANCPWTFVFGNHDDEGNATKKELLAEAQSFPHCMTRNEGTEPGRIGDHVLNVDDTKLVFIDSGAYSDMPDTGRWAWVKRKQIDWFSEIMQKKMSGAPALIFQHIPLPEFNNLENFKGDMKEKISAPKVNSGFFDAMVESGDVKGVFVGHDHLNDADGFLNEIRLVFGRSFGFNPYCPKQGREDARLIILNKSGKLETKILSK